MGKDEFGLDDGRKNEVTLKNTKLVTRTHFEKRNTEAQGWQWFWSTHTPDEVDTVADGGEGYGNLEDAKNGYFSSQGDIDWKPGDPMPSLYRLEKIDAQHYVITKFVQSS